MIDRRAVRKRGNTVIILIGIIGLIFVFRVAAIQIFQHRKYAAYADSQQKSSMPLKSVRGSIYDCEGRLLAYDIETKSYTVNPKYIKNPGAAAKKLSRITGKSSSHWKRQFKKHPGFLYVSRRVSQRRESEFEKSGIETLKARVETLRMYPYGDLASEVIGRTDIDSRGVSGLEKYYDDVLSGMDGKFIFLRDAQGKEVSAWEHTIIEPQNGSDIYLTLDLDLQQIVEDELKEMLDFSRSIWGSAIFLDVNGGGVLACATVEKDALDFPRCRSIVDMNEPGSTAKIITLATVFQAGIFEPDDIINVEGGRFSIGRRLIRDDHPYDSLRCDEIGIYSSNIGVSKMGMAAGTDLIYRFLLQFGFGAKTGIDFPGESAGVVHRPEKWNDHLLANICFGYGIAVTGIQLASAYGIIASGGVLYKPFFASKMVSPDGDERILNSKTKVRKVIDDRTVQILQDILLGVVQLGTGRKARDEICLIAGKTGTALRTKKEGRGYDPGRSLASFVGFFPANDPRVVGVVMFDEPETSIYGGEVSAPVLRNIAKRYISLPRNSALVQSDRGANKAGEYSTVSSAGNPEIIRLASVRLAREEIAPVGDLAHNVLPDFRGKTIRDALRLANSLEIDCEIAGSGIVVSQEPSPGVSLSGVESLVLSGKSK